MKVLILGGGIGGLTTALALKQRGIDYCILEQAPELHEVGAGITLWANAIKVLDRLGVGAAVRAQRAQTGPTALRYPDGNVIAAIDPQAMERAFGAPMVALHRADLQRILADGVPAQKLVFGARCVGVDTTGSGVGVRCADGRLERGDVLVGADGFHSVVRTHVLGETPARYSGYTSWRGISAHYHTDLPAGEFWGRGVRFGIVPINGNRTYWFATTNAPEGKRYDVPEIHPTLLRIFGTWHRDVRTLIESTPPDVIIQRDLHDRLPVKRWSFGRITLLGDAAHPTTPNLGQGACQAIEDAWVLARCLAQSASIEAALEAYPRERIPHTSRVVHESWKLGRIGQWENPLACSVRNFLVRLLPASLNLKQVAWVAGHEV